MAHLTDEHLKEIFTAFVEAEINPTDDLFNELAKASEKTVAHLKDRHRTIYRDIEGFEVEFYMAASPRGAFTLLLF